ncbi:MAG TPA: hypothetical protein VFH82_07420 [Gemmatimonadota bacterium]|nr:hypothetical protein [Gemmatimonadota bacterium]
MNAPRLYIKDEGSGKHLATNTHVYLVVEDDEGNESEVDISNLVRRVSTDIRIGEPLTATLECFIAGFESRAQAETILLKHIPRRRWWHRRLRDVSTFNVRGVKEAA